MINIVHTNGRRIYVIGTGGTGASTNEGNGYVATVPIDKILERVPDAYKVAGGKDSIRLLEFSRQDSTTLTYWDRVRLAREVLEARRKGYDGVVIVHGTDKMANTAAKLSFLYPAVDIPVVLTGAMVPLGERDSDMPANFLGALRVIADKRMQLPEVTIYFNGRLLKGNRAVKIGGPYVFDTPNYSPIATSEHNFMRLSPSIELTKNGRRLAEDYRGRVKKFSEFADELFDFPPTASHEAGLIELSDDSQLDFDQARNWKGVVIKSWGEGGVTEEDAEIIREWCRQEKIVVVGSRVPYSRVDLEKYQVGMQALRAGAIGTGDTPPDTSYEKLKFALGTGETDNEAIKRFLLTDYVGERTPQVSVHPVYKPMDNEELNDFLRTALERKRKLAITELSGSNGNGSLYVTGRPEISRTG